MTVSSICGAAAAFGICLLLAWVRRRNIVDTLAAAEHAASVAEGDK